MSKLDGFRFRPQQHRVAMYFKIKCPHCEKFLKVREEVAREVEKMRAAKEIGSGLEVTVELFTEDEPLKAMLAGMSDMLSIYLLTSDVTLAESMPDGAVQGVEIQQLYVKVSKSDCDKCVRCWNFRKSVGETPSHPDLCSRCVKVVDNSQWRGRGREKA